MSHTSRAILVRRSAYRTYNAHTEPENITLFIYAQDEYADLEELWTELVNDRYYTHLFEIELETEKPLEDVIDEITDISADMWINTHHGELANPNGSKEFETVEDHSPVTYTKLLRHMVPTKVELLNEELETWEEREDVEDLSDIAFEFKPSN